MATYHSPAPSVRAIAERLINAEPELRHLRGIRIEYLFQSEASRSGGKLTLGKARKISGFNALLSTAAAVDNPEATSEGLEFFLLTVAYDTWELMNAKQREALTYHELKHFNVFVDDDGDYTLSIQPHDVEVFADELRKYGLWKQDLAAFVHNIGSDMLSLWADSVAGEEHSANFLREGSGLFLAPGENDTLPEAAAQDEPPFK